MPRPSNKAHILAAGKDLIYAKGYSAVGIQEIADASGVPKGSFYNYFKSKQAFAVEALSAYTEEMSLYLEDALLTGSGSPIGRLRRMLGRWANSEFDELGAIGCMAGNLSQEIAIRDTVLQRAVKASFSRLERYYAECLTQAKNAGELPEGTDPRRLAHFIYNSWQGAMLRAKAEGNSKPLKECHDMIFKQMLS